MNDFYDLKSEIVKLREEGMKLVDPSQPDSFKTMQSTFTMLNDRVENLEVFAEIRSTQIKVMVVKRCTVTIHNNSLKFYFHLQLYAYTIFGEIIQNLGVSVKS